MERKFVLRLDEDLYLRLQYIADYEDRSTNSQIVSLIRREVDKFESEHGAIDLKKRK